MKKIVLLVVLLGLVIYMGSTIYTRNNRSQLAQVGGGQATTGGTLLSTKIQAGETILFTLTTTQALSDADISNMYLELINTGRPIFPIKVSVAGNVTTLSAKIPSDITPKENYEVMLGSVLGYNDGLGWSFSELLTVTAIPATVAVTPLTASQEENEADVHSFNISYTQPDIKNPTLYRITWSGAGRGVATAAVKGSGATYIKQLMYQSTFPLEASGYKPVSPFFYIAAEGFGDAGYSDTLLINTSAKTQTVEVVFYPKGKNGSVIPTYAKTLEIKVPPTPVVITALNKTKFKIGDIVTAQTKSVVPVSDLYTSLRRSSEVVLVLSPVNKKNIYKTVDTLEVKTDGRFTFTIPETLDTYQSKAGKLEKTGTQPIKPGKYTLSLKTLFGYTNYTIVIY